MKNTPACISLSEVSFSYGRAEVIKNLSLEIEPGEVTGIVGPNGAGKSTIIKLIGGILTPSNGRILVGGREIGPMRPVERARLMAVVPQESRIPFSYRSIEVVLSGRAPHLPAFGFESERDVAIARDAMAETDCARFEDRHIDSLSGGEKQRVVIARALAQKTPVLLMDEPTAFLDVSHQASLHRLLAEKSARDGLTVVAAMHDLNMASAFCGRIVMIKDGAVAAEGAPREVLTAETIDSVFDARVSVGTDPATGNAYVIPLT